MPLVGGLVTSRTSTKSGPKKMCPSSEDFVTSQTSTKCGPKMCPLSEDFVTSRTSTKYGPKMCPSSEDFVTSRTSTRYGPKMCPSLEDFATSRAFDQVLSDMCRSSRQITITFEKKADFWYPQYERYLSHFEGQHNRNIEPNSIKMTLITSTMQRQTNDELRKQQSMPNDAALYINGIRYRFIAFTWTI